MRRIIASKRLWIGLLLVTGLLPIAYWQRGPLLAWYYVRELSRAYEEKRDGMARRVASLDEAAVPRLLSGLSNADPLVCVNLTYAMTLLCKRWGQADARAERLIAQVHGRYDEFSPAGQEKAILFLAQFLQIEGPRPLPDSLAKPIGDLLLRADKNEKHQTAALLLAAELIDVDPVGPWVDACRAMADRGMTHSRKATRIAAVQTLVRGPLRNERGLHHKAIALLKDKETLVRRAAVIALASAPELVREESLLHLLHDDDLEVQYLCEIALAKRGLTPEEIELGRDISDRDPLKRMRVLHRLYRVPDLNVAAWVRQLSQDPTPAVRAAAVRAAGESGQAELLERLREIAEQDPSETVRLNARFYLQDRVVAAAE